MKMNPKLEVLLTFWQPRSVDLLETDDWMIEVEKDDDAQYYMKPEMEDAWAEEIVKRTKQFLAWGINATNIGVQNETNYSHLGTQTCMWDPFRLRDFIDEKLQPKLDQAGLEVLITAPDLAYVGYKGSELERFLPTIRSKQVDLVAYHMYDSYQEGTDGSLEILRENSRRIGQIRREHFPGKRFWMTETTGAQWNNEVWHTYGWTPGASEFDKAILAGRYMHMTFADAQANAFFWWGLVYSLAPDKETDPNVREKHRDEGLVLVEEKGERTGCRNTSKKPRNSMSSNSLPITFGRARREWKSNRIRTSRCPHTEPTMGIVWWWLRSILPILRFPSNSTLGKDSRPSGRFKPTVRSIAKVFP